MFTHMHPPLLFWIAVGTMVFCAVKLLQTVFGSGRGLFAPKPLCTQNEIEFFGRLRDAFPDHVILTQVAMGALLRPSALVSRKRFLAVRGRFAQKIIDFVVADPSTLAVVALVELDDRSHDAMRDRARDAMTASAGYVTHRFQSRRRPSVGELRAAVLNADSPRQGVEAQLSIVPRGQGQRPSSWRTRG